MSLSRETQETLQSAIKKMAGKYISAEESNVTDFHLKVNGENGESPMPVETPAETLVAAIFTMPFRNSALSREDTVIPTKGRKIR